VSAQSRSRVWSASVRRSASGRTLATVLGAAVLSLALAGPASAAAIVIRGAVTTPIFETDLPDDCRPGITGVLSGTDVVSYQSVETSQGFHIVLTVVDTGQIAWSDGTYTIIEAIGHGSFVNTVAGTTVSTVAHEDSGNTYSVDGVFLSRAAWSGSNSRGATPTSSTDADAPLRASHFRCSRIRAALRHPGDLAITPGEAENHPS
jgi:hypothetical protein